MKQKIKNLVAFFIARLNALECHISINELSVYFSIYIAILTLRRKNENILQINFDDFHNQLDYELKLINQRFPELIEIYISVEKKINRDLLEIIFDKLLLIFEDKDDEIDDIISWSYQFLKKNLEKKAFKKIGKNSTKIGGLDLLYTTQFFTDKYMVKFLIDSCLDKVNEENIESIILIDPASGGGNFLNYSFEKLFHIYKIKSPNWSNQKIVDSIFSNSILGYDLDENLSKIASLALFIKACEYAVPNINTPIYIYGGIKGDNIGFLDLKVKSNLINRKSFQSFFERNSIIQKKRKFFMTNPPFMGKRDMDTRLKDYLLTNYPESKADLCVSFLQKIIRLLEKEDILGVVTQKSWMHLSSFKKFRKIILDSTILKSCIDLGSNSFKDINGEKTNIALCIFDSSTDELSEFLNLKNKSLTEKKDIISKIKIPKQLFYKINQNTFLKQTKFEFNYQLIAEFKNIQKLPDYSLFAKPMQGTSTGNNSIFVKFAWEVNGNSEWRLVSKGGGFSKWSGLNYYKVHWGENAERIKENKGSALRNIDKIPSTQLVYSDTGTLGLNVRILKEKQVFIASGPGIQVLEGDKFAHLAFLNSRVATFLLKLINPKFSISAGYISKIPVPKNILFSKSISEDSKECLVLKETYLERKLPNFEFEHYNYKDIKDVNVYLEESIINDVENDYKRLLLESKIEFEIKKEYVFNKRQLEEMQTVVGETPFSNKKKSLKISTSELDRLIASNIDLNCLVKSRTINGYSIGSESIFESLSYQLNVHPKIILKRIKKEVIFLQETKNKYLNDLIHKIILKEVGVKNIFTYQYKEINISELYIKIKENYQFLLNGIVTEETIDEILKTHHKYSFFNKPLISINNKAVAVGQIHND